jgi:hypothetical protein
MTQIEVEYFPSHRRTLAFLERPLQAMGTLLDRYINTFQNLYDEAEIPYKYNERATLSQFAGGIWQADPNNLVLEEFTCDKECDTGTYRGRNDIWFSAGGRRCYGEAKQEWDELSRRGPRRITAAIKALVSECDTAHANSGNDRKYGLTHFPLGIVFLVLTAMRDNAGYAERYLSDCRAALRSAVSALVQSRPYDVIWGSYHRLELLNPSRLYDADEGWLARPALETLICVKNDGTYTSPEVP